MKRPPTNQGHRLPPLQRDGTLRIREKNSLNFSTVADVDPGTLEPAAGLSLAAEYQRRASPFTDLSV